MSPSRTGRTIPTNNGKKDPSSFRSSSSTTRHQSLNRSQLKSLTDNLRLRLRYAKLKVINGWHHQTLNEIESTMYYLPSKHPRNLPSSSNQLGPTNPLQDQDRTKPHNPEPSLSSSLSSTSPASTSSIFSGDLNHQSKLNPASTSSAKFKLPSIPPSTRSNSHQPPVDHTSTQPTVPTLSQLDSIQPQDSIEQEAYPIGKSDWISTTTLTLPLKYSTPFKKIIRTSGPYQDRDLDQLMTNESNRFWSAGNLTCLSSTSSVRTRSKRRPSNGFSFRFANDPGSTNMMDSNDLTIENELCFKADEDLEDFKGIYKQSSPASFLFNHHRSILASSSINRSSSKPFPNSHHVELLNSVSPVKIRSNLQFQHQQAHHQLNQPPLSAHRALIRMPPCSLISPTPNRTQAPSHHRSSALSNANLGGDETGSDEDHQMEDEDGQDKENVKSSIGLLKLDHKQSPSLKLVTINASPTKFRLPQQCFPAHPRNGAQLEETSMAHEIGLDDLDELNWE